MQDAADRNLATVQAMYEAFARGAVPAILARLAEGVAWESWADNHAQRAGVPWLVPRRGPAEVREFFGVVGGFQMHEFRVLGLMAGGDQVAAEIVIDAQPAGARRYRDEEIHLWTFDAEGKVVRFRHYVDTAKHVEAARG
jgi:ketosteroid isomerase-like protein